VQSQPRASSLPAILDRVRRRKLLDWFLISSALSKSNLASALCDKIRRAVDNYYDKAEKVHQKEFGQ
jgi:hypothetical protein